jgi:hypothetical protein
MGLAFRMQFGQLSKTNTFGETMKNLNLSKMILIGLIASAGFLTACQPASNNAKKLSYQYNSNSCDTGAHSFNSLAEYCTGLIDEELNNGCAFDMRLNEFQNICEAPTPSSKTSCDSTPTYSPNTLPKANAIGGAKISTTILSWTRNPSGYTTSATFTGTLSVDEFTDGTVDSYDLSTASGLSNMSDDGHCKTDLVLESAKVNGKVSFNLLVQQEPSSPYNCVLTAEHIFSEGALLKLSNVSVKLKNGMSAVKDDVVLQLSAKLY